MRQANYTKLYERKKNLMPTYDIVPFAGPDEVLVKETSGYEIPPEGIHQAVCVDIINLGEVETKFGVKPQVAIVFQLECEGGYRRTDGQRFEIRRIFNPTLTGSSTLKKFLEQWRGKSFDKAELEGFQLAKLHKTNAQIQVIHKEGEKGMYANIVSIQPHNLKLGQRIVPEAYQRRLKKDDPLAPATAAATTADEDEIPF
jgi:hypothetical protein